MADDTPGMGGRIRRYARVTGTMGNLAMRMAGERYLGIKVDRENHATQLRDALGNLKGPLMKVAQILATIPEALPREYAEELANLQTDAPSMGWLFVKRRMATELGSDWQSRFVEFEKQAAAAASLGQVHRALHSDGRKLACKLQYPDMRAAVEADLRQLKLIFSIYERYDKAISTGKSTLSWRNGSKRNSITAARSPICGSTGSCWLMKPGPMCPNRWLIFPQTDC